MHDLYLGRRLVLSHGPVVTVNTQKEPMAPRGLPTVVAMTDKPDPRERKRQASGSHPERTDLRV
jgi:hypothetical protein